MRQLVFGHVCEVMYSLTRTTVRVMRSIFWSDVMSAAVTSSVRLAPVAKLERAPLSLYPTKSVT